MKVYCNDCRFYRCDIGFDCCEAPGNVGDTYRGPRSQFKNSPCNINAQNDCKMYQFTARCSECEYIRIGGEQSKCIHHSNLITVWRRSFWGGRAMSEKCILLPSQKNANGKCHFFRKRNMVVENET